MKIPRSSRVVFSDLLDADPARKERVGSGLVGGTGPYWATGLLDFTVDAEVVGRLAGNLKKQTED